MDAVFGEISVINCSEGMSKINHIIVRHPKSTAALLIKMRLLLASKEWDQAMDTANRILLMQPSNVFALHVRTLFEIFEPYVIFSHWFMFRNF